MLKNLNQLSKQANYLDSVFLTLGYVCFSNNYSKCISSIRLKAITST